MTDADANARQHERRLVRCRHFTGIQNKTCAAGVLYRSKRDVSRPGMATWPCVDRDCPTTCDQYSAPTAEEVAAEEVEIGAAVREVEERMAAGLCVYCGAPIAKAIQVGRCVYAEPCGHRQGQWTVSP